MDLPRDFSELLASFNANGVECMLASGRPTDLADLDSLGEA
jgi:hypothetical protein